jgi:hypothetical protein
LIWIEKEGIGMLVSCICSVYIVREMEPQSSVPTHKSITLTT